MITRETRNSKNCADVNKTRSAGAASTSKDSVAEREPKLARSESRELLKFGSMLSDSKLQLKNTLDGKLDQLQPTPLTMNNLMNRTFFLILKNDNEAREWRHQRRTVNSIFLPKGPCQQTKCASHYCGKCKCTRKLTQVLTSSCHK